MIIIILCWDGRYYEESKFLILKLQAYPGTIENLAAMHIERWLSLNKT